MNKLGCFALAGLSLMLGSCQEKKERPAVETPYELPVDEDIVLQRDTFLTGVLGEESGMGSLQIITDEGDTVNVYKTSPDGYEGKMLGDVRNYTDRVSVSARISEGDEFYLLSFLNVSQLEDKWAGTDVTLNLKKDSTVVSSGTNYTHWRTEGTLLLLIGDHVAEFGHTQRTDTAVVDYLDIDSLHLSIPRHGKLRLGREQ